MSGEADLGPAMRPPRPGAVLGVGAERSLHRPRPACGDPVLAASLHRLRSRRTGGVAAARIDLDAETACRMAFIGADADTVFEVGSLTKGLTGMVLADAVARREMRLDTAAGDIVPEWAAAPFGSITLRKLCTHTSGLPRLPRSGRLLLRTMLFVLWGLDPYRGVAPRRVLELAAIQPLQGRGQYRYSNLGGAVAGQLLARATGTDYATLLRDRILTPLRMDATAVAHPGCTAPPGRSARGRTLQPWILDGYAPAGGVVSTVGDLARLANAVLEGRAPRGSALEALAMGPPGPHRPMGMFWMVEPGAGAAERMVWHNGQTGGHTSFMAQRIALEILRGA